MGARAASRGAWTGATIAMRDGLTGAVTDRAAPFLLYGAYGRATWPSILCVAFHSDWFAGHKRGNDHG